MKERIAELAAQIEVRKKLQQELKEGFENELKALKKKKRKALGELYKEIIKLQTRLRYWKHPERYTGYRKEYYEKNREQILAQARKKRLKDPASRERRKEYNHAYYLKRKAAGFYEREKA